MPLKVFEVSDVGFKDETRERRARNERHLCATYTSKTSGFEVGFLYIILVGTLLLIKVRL